MSNKTHIALVVGIAFFFFFPPTVAAEEVVVIGNGPDSTNTVTVSDNNQTAINQSNNADVSNSASVQATTGDNDASYNTGGDTSVTTGDAFVDTDISSAANASIITEGCCPQNGGSNQAVISDNGTDSQNTIGISNSSQTTITSVQSAQITNSISGIAVTGNNQANSNTTGNVRIQTGNISVNENIQNKADRTTVSLAAFVAKEASVTIFGNGSESRNKIDIIDITDTTLDIDNSADIFNRIAWNLITGGNKANGNTGGNISIFTGNIAYNSEITNAVNESEVTVNSCCPEEEEKPQVPSDKAEPSMETKITTKTESNPPGSGGGGKGGDLLGASTQNLLPVTGNNWFYFALFANVIMLFYGAMLRLRAGRSPGFAFA
ncbi:MAG: hypothetical protein HY431_01930 [Candidatus Levybacteria bacterium]|nr:hypothetical protein [Candidatus Levybacteria bacterium]